MKTSTKQNFEKVLPHGYRQALYINAKNAKFGIIFNLIALAVLVVVIALAVISLRISDRAVPSFLEMEPLQLLSTYAVFIVITSAYVVLHELVHGIAYKAQTGEKLTFGVSWSCAFCGVPHIYTYRKTALIAVVAPFAVFTLLFIPILILLYFVSPLYYMIMAVVFGLHLGGCSGDLYVLYLLTKKFKNKNTLMRDTGPEQFFYVYEGADN